MTTEKMIQEELKLTIATTAVAVAIGVVIAAEAYSNVVRKPKPLKHSNYN